MSQVVLLSHLGVRCAVPADQVVRAGGAEDEPEIRLWGGDRREEEARRTVLVDTAAGRRRIGCSEARFARVDDASMMPLPHVLSTCLRLPHVVGLGASDDDLVWLVDLACWEEP